MEAITDGSKSCQPEPDIFHAEQQMFLPLTAENAYTNKKSQATRIASQSTAITCTSNESSKGHRNVSGSTEATTITQDTVPHKTLPYNATLSGTVMCSLHGCTTMTVQYPQPVVGVTLPASLPCCFCSTTGKHGDHPATNAYKGEETAGSMNTMTGEHEEKPDEGDIYTTDPSIKSPDDIARNSDDAKCNNKASHVAEGNTTPCSGPDERMTDKSAIIEDETPAHIGIPGLEPLEATPPTSQEESEEDKAAAALLIHLHTHDTGASHQEDEKPHIAASIDDSPKTEGADAMGDEGTMPLAFKQGNVSLDDKKAITLPAKIETKDDAPLQAQRATESTESCEAAKMVKENDVSHAKGSAYVRAVISTEEANQPSATDIAPENHANQAESTNESSNYNSKVIQLPFRARQKEPDVSYDDGVETKTEAKEELSYSIPIEEGSGLGHVFPFLNDEGAEQESPANQSSNEQNDENGEHQEERNTASKHTKEEEYSVPIEEGTGLGHVFPFLNFFEEKIEEKIDDTSVETYDVASKDDSRNDVEPQEEAVHDAGGENTTEPAKQESNASANIETEAGLQKNSDTSNHEDEVCDEEGGHESSSPETGDAEKQAQDGNAAPGDSEDEEDIGGVDVSEHKTDVQSNEAMAEDEAEDGPTIVGDDEVHGQQLNAPANDDVTSHVILQEKITKGKGKESCAIAYKADAPQDTELGPTTNAETDTETPPTPSATPDKGITDQTLPLLPPAESLSRSSPPATTPPAPYPTMGPSTTPPPPSPSTPSKHSTPATNKPHETQIPRRASAQRLPRATASLGEVVDASGSGSAGTGAGGAVKIGGRRRNVKARPTKGEDAAKGGKGGGKKRGGKGQKRG